MAMLSLLFRRGVTTYPALAPASTSRAFVTSTSLLAAHTTEVTLNTKAAGTESPEKTKATKAKGSSKDKSVTKAKAKPKTPRIVITADMKPPKKPKNPYIQFLMSQYRARLETHGHVEAQDFFCSVAESWRALSDSDREPYRREAAADLKRYRKAISQWTATVDPAVVREINRLRVARGLSLSHKRLQWPVHLPVNGFIRFAKDIYAQTPYQDFIASEDKLGKSYIAHTTNLAARRWATLSAEEKRPYTEAYANELEEYWVRKDELENPA